MTQQHVGPGGPNGGQFLPSSSGQTPPSVVETNLGVGSASFNYPPNFRTYEHLRDFYIKASIPEDTLDDFKGALKEHWDYSDNETKRAWDVAHPKPRRERDVEVWGEQRNQAFARITSQRPDIHARRIPSLLRIRRMAENAEFLPPAEKACFWKDSFIIPGTIGGMVEPGTGQQLWDKYHLKEVDVDRYRQRERDQLRAIAAGIGRINDTSFYNELNRK